MNTPLTVPETAELKALEDNIATCQKKALELGGLFDEVRNKRLYRHHSTFANYCEARWGCSDVYVYRLIWAYKIAVFFSPLCTEAGLPIPENECQTQPLLEVFKSSPEYAFQLWSQAHKACGGRLTGRKLEAFIKLSAQGKADEDRGEIVTLRSQVAFSAIQHAFDQMQRLENAPGLSAGDREAAREIRKFWKDRLPKGTSLRLSLQSVGAPAPKIPAHQNSPI